MSWWSLALIFIFLARVSPCTGGLVMMRRLRQAKFVTVVVAPPTFRRVAASLVAALDSCSSIMRRILFKTDVAGGYRILFLAFFEAFLVGLLTNHTAVMATRRLIV